MKLLPKPQFKETPEEIFETCVQSFRDEDKKKLLLSCRSLVRIDSQEYDNLIPAQIEDFKQSKLPENLTVDNLVKVYEQKFVEKGAPGRIFYDQIMSLPNLRKCPICGVGTVTTLDHYLPKRKYPTLAVTPNNLIPACRDCNMEKGSDAHMRPDDLPLHIYFDDEKVVREIWLYADFGENSEILYSVRCPKDWEPDICGRVEKHFELYNLQRNYSNQAGNEIVDMQYGWKELLEVSGVEELCADIRRKRKGLEKNDLNSWRAALYRCLEKNIQLLTTYLENMVKNE